LEWKDQRPNENFENLHKTSPRTAHCRLCIQIAEKQNQLDNNFLKPKLYE